MNFLIYWLSDCILSFQLFLNRFRNFWYTKWLFTIFIIFFVIKILKKDSHLRNGNNSFLIIEHCIYNAFFNNIFLICRFLKKVYLQCSFHIQNHLVMKYERGVFWCCEIDDIPKTSLTIGMVLKWQT